MGTLVGREREQARLLRAMANARADVGGFVAIRGEAGIGKTALARWAADRARADGWWVLYGSAHAGGTHLSYAPIVEAFGRLLRGLPQDACTELTARISGLGLLFPGLVGDDVMWTGDADLSQTIALESVRALLVRLASQRPVMLVVDDVQWADPATLHALGYLSGEVAGASIVVVVTVRDGDDARRPEVRSALASFRRVADVDVIEPQRLDASEIAVVLSNTLGYRADASTVGEVMQRSAGTPLFVEAIARQLAEHEGRAHVRDLPGVVHDVIGELLAGLDDAGTRVAQVASLGAEPVPEPAARRASGLDDAAFDDAVAELIMRCVLDDDHRGRGVIAPAHPLIGEVIERSMSTSARVDLHHRLFVALDDATDPEVRAVHATAAGALVEPAAAVSVLVSAGEQAARRQAHQSAIRHLGDALERSAAVSDRSMALEIRVLLVDALIRAREYAAAEAVAREGLVDDTDDVEHLRLLSRLETACWLQGRGDDELAAMGEALAGVAITDRRAAVLDAAELLVSARARREQRREAMAANAALIERTSGATDPDSRVLHAIALASEARMTGRLLDAGALLPEARRIAETYGLAHRLRRIELLELDIALRRGPVVVVRELGERVRRNGSASVPWRDAIVDHVCGLAELEPGWATGAAAEQGDEDAWPLRQPVTMAHRAWAAGDAHLARAAVDLARRLAMSDRRGRGVADEDLWVVSAGHLVLTADMSGATVLAVEIERDGDRRFTWAPAAELICALAAFAGARELHRTTCAALRNGDADDGWSSAVAALCEASIAPVAERIPMLLGAADRFEVVGDRFRLAVSLTAALEAGADRALAARLVSLLEPVERCGLGPLARRIRAVVGAAAPADARPATLTRRQFEIAELVAQGLSNAAVADRLCVSVRTVTSHLDHIYTRLGVRNRTELAVRLRDLR